MPKLLKAQLPQKKLANCHGRIPSAQKRGKRYIEGNISDLNDTDDDFSITFPEYLSLRESALFHAAVCPRGKEFI